MAHADQFEFISLVRAHFPTYFERVSVLEIGSLDINGSIRSSFAAASYVGVDVAAGPGVDEVCQGQLVGYPSGTFDVVISCECMEHNPFWVETVSNMFRMAKPGGLIIVSCATTGRAEHGTTRSNSSDSPLSIGLGWEYYRNVSISDFKRSFNLDYWCDEYLLLANWNNCDLYFVGVRKPAANASTIAPLREALAERFGPAKSIRALVLRALATVLGDRGINGLRAMRRLVS